MPKSSFRCASSKCGIEFEAPYSKVECPRCGDTRGSWIPKPFGIAKQHRDVDRELRLIADGMGLTDLRSARAGESARPRAPSHAKTFKWSPAAGMGAIDVGIDRNTGAALPSSGWTGDVVPIKVPERMTYREPGIPGLGRTTVITHRDPRRIA